MTFKKTANYEKMSMAAANWIVAEVRRKPDSLICFPTGGTPERTYELLVGRARKSPEFFSRIHPLKLDEWHGLEMMNNATCETHLQRRIMQPLGLSPRKLAGFASNSRKPALEGRRMAKWVKKNGPIDLCILGLGANGHLGLNEPAEALKACAHVVRLEKATRNHAMLADCATKPTHGLTLGMGEILQSRKILLLVAGRNKQTAWRRFLDGDISTQSPVSFLWLHPDVTIIYDGTAVAVRSKSVK